jgi:hypothetical protein
MEQINTQTFGHPYGSTSGTPHLVQQTAAVFPSAGLAQTFFNTAQTQWESCTAGEVDANLGYETRLDTDSAMSGGMVT